VSLRPAAVTRGRLVAAAMLIVMANALGELVKAAVAGQGFFGALPTGLGVSWAVWLSLGLGVRLALTAEPAPARALDWMAAAAGIALAAVPVTGVASLGATLIGGWFLVDPRADDRLKAAGAILVALAVNLMWSKLLLMLFARPIENLDAGVVGLVRGVAVHGNVIDFVHGDERVAVLSGCTSVANASLALLLWLAVTRSVRPKPVASEFGYAAALFVTIVVINLVRLSLVADSRAAWAYWHGPVGDSVVDALITAAAMAWAVVGARREIFR
jgi:hypothetical protein